MIKNLTNTTKLRYFCEPKMDGAAISLVYENGILKFSLAKKEEAKKHKPKVIEIA